MTQQQRKGFTCGSFDLFHAGHVAMLEWCAGRCTHLIVGLQLDPSVDRPTKNKPLQSIVERTIQLRACRHVDEVIVYQTEQELIELLHLMKIDVRFLGEDYKRKPFTGKDLCKKLNIEVEYNPRQHSFSSSELRSRLTTNNKE